MKGTCPCCLSFRRARSRRASATGWPFRSHAPKARNANDAGAWCRTSRATRGRRVSAAAASTHSRLMRRGQRDSSTGSMDDINRGSHGSPGSDGSHGSHGSEDSHGPQGSPASEYNHGSHGSENRHRSHGSHGSEDSNGSHGSHGSEDSHGSHGSHGSEDSQGPQGSAASEDSHGSHGSHGAEDGHGSHGSHGSEDSDASHRCEVEALAARGAEGAARGPVGRPFELFLIAGVVIFDQLTKLAVRVTLPLHESRHIIPSLLDFTHVQNTGAAFGLLNAADFPYKSAVMIVVAALALVAISLYARQLGTHEQLSRYGLALILGGAFGNLIYRALSGYVIDFVDVYWGDAHFWAFNIADAAITIGAVLVLLEMLGLGRRHAPHPA